MAIVLALVAANGLFNILVWGGEVTTDEDPVDQEGVGGFGEARETLRLAYFCPGLRRRGSFAQEAELMALAGMLASSASSLMWSGLLGSKPESQGTKRSRMG
jgi:hypothetical protein